VAAEFDKFERSPPLPQERKPNELRTFRLPIDLGYQHPNGLFGNLAAINVRQKIDGLAANGEDDEHFWTVNGSIGYRLPKRRGIIELQVRNLFDQDFKYFGLDFQSGNVRRLEFLPERTIAVHASLNF
jgi:outer membrane receptor protein involved in Fe transport